MDDRQLALAHYRLQFPTLESLGAGEIPANWKAEYERVASQGLSATLVTSTSFEGGSGSGVRNFDQKILIAALHTRRAELDADYDETAFSPPGILPRQRMGFIVQVG